jgi:hypothetical protein
MPIADTTRPTTKGTFHFPLSTFLFPLSSFLSELGSSLERIRMLFIARGGRGRRRCGWSRSRSCVPHVQPLLPSIAFATINLYPVTFGVHRAEFLPFESRTPFPATPRLVASRSYNVGGILIALIEMVAELNLLEHVCPMLHE